MVPAIGFHSIVVASQSVHRQTGKEHFLRGHVQLITNDEAGRNLLFPFELRHVYMIRHEKQMLQLHSSTKA